ncbi:periplasmic heavy metal sensor [Agrobacterium sp. CCNWLW32]|uniref:Spy/CpxP family protein refolding chaperone n=1 Tax=Agrobacterium TaxID=357 RepID=UPI000DCF71C2|nr:periplasmic heavy metal sensor [Agrobacterium tumefaciens]NTE66808.1 periplasmic heavy metal sensor [Agrobacterium tumefaciens]
MKFTVPVFLIAFLPLSTIAEEQHRHQSPYAGQQSRTIKSLSAEDIAELEQGGGWGFAKAADLNGMPGPSHVGKMATELALTAEQTAAVEQLFQTMRKDAATEGRQMIAGEAALDASFRNGAIDADQLRAQLDRIEESRARLRYIHLAAHLETVKLLTKEQIARYNKLRGYAP